MNKESQNIYQYLEKLEEFKLPTYEEFPSIPLYMEQVVTYIGDCLEIFSGRRDDPYNSNVITPFMVNNYVKAKIITPPSEKKYSKEHLAYLLAIALLKPVVPMRDIATLIDLDKEFFKDKKNVYNFFKKIQEETLKKEIKETKFRVKTLSKLSEEKMKVTKEEGLETLNLSYVALKLYIESETKKQLADAIMKEIASNQKSKLDMKKLRKETILENKKSHKEAKKIAQR